MGRQSLISPLPPGRRRLLGLGAAAGLIIPAGAVAIAAGKWGESQGFPTGWGPAGQQQRWEGYTEYHVGNFSGGIEKMFAHATLSAGPASAPAPAKRRASGSFAHNASYYLRKFDRMGLLVVRDDEILFEEYGFARQPAMRFFGWSMTKSIVGLLTGIAVGRGLIASIDDPLEKYIPRLRGHVFADLKLRNLLNMTSGIDICEAYCTPNNGFERYGYSQIGYSPKRGQGTDQIEGVLQFRWGRNEQQGMRFNYTDLCPVLVAWVLEETTKLPLATFAERALWQPMGARSDATWLVDAKGFTFSGAGVSATLHDWARLGSLIAANGVIGGRQIVPGEWIAESARHTDKDKASRFDVARPRRGYRNFIWHKAADGRVLRFAGNHAQNVLIDQKTRTVLVQSAPGYVNGADEEMLNIFDAACGL